MLTVCSPTAKHLQTLKNGKTPVEILTVDTKKPETRTEAFEKCADVIKTAGKKVGILPNTEATGPFADEWKKIFGDMSKDVEEVDVAPALSMAFAIKDENELRSMRTASRIASGLFVDYWVDEMADVLDSGKKITHAALSQKINAKIDDNSFFKKITRMLPEEFDSQQLDWAYGPVVQSGGQYDFKLGAQSNTENLHSGGIIEALGFRYKTYCAMVGRSYLIDPSPSVRSNYKILKAAHDAVIAELRDGIAAKDVYNKALGVIKSKKPDLEKHFARNVGAAIGIEISDSSLVLNGKSSKTLRDGMTLSIRSSLSDLTNDKAADKRGSTYSLLLVDTVRLTKNGTAVFTRDTPDDIENVEFYFKDDEEDAKPKHEKSKKPGASAVVTSNIKSSRLRGADRKDNAKEEEEARRRQHQKDLADKKQRQGMEKYAEATGSMNGDSEKKFKRFESYKRDNQLPPKVKDLIVWVDLKASTVIIPVMGRPVPFHINTIKSVSKSDEGQ